MRGENGSDVERQHRALDVGGGVSFRTQCTHRPASPTGLRLVAFRGAVRAGASNAMNLFRRVDQEEEERESTRNVRRALDRERGHLLEQCGERWRIRLRMPSCATRSSEAFD